MTRGILALTFPPSPDGRAGLECRLAALLLAHGLGRITGGGEDIRSGHVDIEVDTVNAEALLAQLKAAGIVIGNAVLIETD